MNLFPFFENIEGKIFLIIGGGKVAERKAGLLLRFQARVLVIAPETSIPGTYIEPEADWGEARTGPGTAETEMPDPDSQERNSRLRDMIRGIEGICILKKTFDRQDVLLGDYVIAATDDREQNRMAARECVRWKIPVNVVDDPALCTFIFPSLIKKGPLTVGITTGGSSPAASRLLRERIEELLPDETEEILKRMERFRESWKSCPSERAKKNANRRALIRLLETGNQASDEEIGEIMTREREKNWVIATRGSALAMVQAEIVRGLLQGKGIEAQIRIVSTRGDRDRTRPLSEIGGKGLFVREIERELLSQNADIAVHSGKDLPYELTEGTVIGGIPAGADFRDCLITRKRADAGSAEEALDSGRSLTGKTHSADVPTGGSAQERASAGEEGAAAKIRIGTGSPRRIVQLKKLFPNMSAAPIRGNVDTRLQKLREGSYEGLILAKAGLDRLHTDLSDFEVRVFSQEEFLPAACQGILAVQCRAEDAFRRKILEEISDPDTVRRFTAERYMLRLMEADCSDPIGVHADVEEGQIRIQALYGTARAQRLGDWEDYQRLCEEIADEIIRKDESNERNKDFQGIKIS